MRSRIYFIFSLFERRLRLAQAPYYLLRRLYATLIATFFTLRAMLLYTTFTHDDGP